MKTRLGKFAISKVLLVDLIGFPSNHQIINIYPDAGKNGGEVVWVTVIGPDMPEVEQGALIPEVEPIVRKRPDLTMTFEANKK